MIRVLLDTTCLVAAACQWHDHHPATIQNIRRRRSQRHEFIMAAPALLEAYSVLTRLPTPHRIKPSIALEILHGQWGQSEVHALSGQETWQLLGSLPARDVRGGASHDAEIIACAMKAEADVILTWNLRHFERIATGVAVEAPPLE